MCIFEEFRKKGALVEVIDKVEGDHYDGDISDKMTLEAFAEHVIEKYGHIDYLINNMSLTGMDRYGLYGL